MSQWTAAQETAGLPTPRPTAISRPHWDGCREGRLMVQRCEACETYVFPPQAACTCCFSDRLAWVESTGRGEIYSYTVVHRPQRPEFAAPYVVIIVELEEGWRMLSNLIEADPETAAVGQPVEVTYVPRGEIVMPMFRRR